MERHVKERLIGAAVLIAAAIILIPEMLSGPDRLARSEGATAHDAAPLKTYTIDLSKSPATLAAESAIDNRAPPPEAQVSTAEPAITAQTNPDQANPDQTNPESTPTAIESAAANDTSEAPATAGAPPAGESLQASRQPAAEAVAPPRPPAPAPASGSTVSDIPAAARSAGAGWAVQLGSFASRVTAERMVKSLQADGHDAFVMPVKSGQATLYRVRIGPMKDRESAAQLLRKVKATAPGAAIVAQP